MKCLVRIFFTVNICWITVLSLYHEPSARSIEANTSLPRNSAFGYSMTYMRKSKRFMISAPFADQTGRIFICNINTSKCEEISNKLEGQTDKVRDYGGQQNHSILLGARVKYWNDSAVVCAPRYLDDISHTPSKPKYGTFGRCYNYQDTITSKLSPLPQNVFKSGSIENVMLTYGWSIDTFKNEMLVGGPGMLIGRVQLFKETSKMPKSIIPYLPNRGSVVKFNFGYSVVFGKFIENDDDFAVASPYGSVGYGMVYLHVKERLLTVIKDDKVGSLFGSAMCSARLFDGHSSLLVGAPSYSHKNGMDSGAVYLYGHLKSSTSLTEAWLFDKTGVDSSSSSSLSLRLPQQTRISIIGSQSSGYFGSAIVNLGDIDNDGKEDIAIGAPYEDNSAGAVYIYLGNELARERPKPIFAQRIRPAGSAIRGFGASLATLDDYDGNGCNELVVGAPDSNLVVLYKCMASVTLKVETPTVAFQQINSKDRNQTFFILKTCFTVAYPEKPRQVVGDVEMTVSLQHSHAQLQGGRSLIYNTSLASKAPEYCNLVEVLTPLDGNYNQAIQVSVTATLPVKQETEIIFDGNRVILSKNSLLTNRKSIWATNCKEHVCLPELEVEISTDLRDGYIIGSTSNMSLSVSVLNVGEIAYSACVIISNVRTSFPPMYCSKDKNSWVCPMILQTNGFKVINVTLDTSTLTSADKTYNIQVDTYNYCESGNVTDTHTTTINLKAVTEGIVIESKPRYIVYSAKNRQENRQQTDTINLIISQRGPTSWVDAWCIITIQKSPYMNITLPTVMFKNYPIPCTWSNVSNFEGSAAMCNIERISKAHDVTIVIPVNVQVSQVTVRDLPFEINMELHLGEENITKSFELLVKLEPILEVPLWIYILSSVIGLLVIIMIGYILNELNCFRRRKREEMKIRRESFRRSVRASMRESQIAYESLQKNTEQVVEE